MQNLGLKSFKLIASSCREFGSAVFVKVELQAKELKSIGELLAMGNFECNVSECVINKMKLVILSIYSGYSPIISNLWDNEVEIRFLSRLNNFSVQALMDEYTRITNHFESYLYHILTNSSNILSSEILEFPIFCS